MKNWDFFLLSPSAGQGKGLAGELRMSYTSRAKALMSTDRPSLWRNVILNYMSQNGSNFYRQQTCNYEAQNTTVFE